MMMIIIIIMALMVPKIHVLMFKLTAIVLTTLHSNYQRWFLVRLMPVVFIPTILCLQKIRDLLIC